MGGGVKKNFLQRAVGVLGEGGRVARLNIHCSECTYTVQSAGGT